MPQNFSFRPLTDEDVDAFVSDVRDSFITAAAPVAEPAVADTEADDDDPVDTYSHVGSCENCGESIERNDEFPHDYRSEVTGSEARECDRCCNVLCLECYRDNGTCEDCRCTCGDCEECGYSDDDDTGSGYVRSWNWKPSTWRPKGEYPNAPLLGVELELHGETREIVSAVRSVDDDESHLYMKEDGSISGVEVVAHPGTLAWEVENRVWQRAMRALEYVAEAPAGYGLHVHVSRNAFRHNGTRSRVHDMVWLKFIYGNADALKVLSRRDWRDYEDGRWCKFARPDAMSMREMTRWGSDGYRWDRYLAVNCNNERTYELRFFRATMEYSQLLAAMQFATASVEYTRGLLSRDVIAGALAWDRFAAWLADKPEYAELSAEIEDQADDIAAAIVAGEAIERERLHDGRANMDYRWQQLANARARREQERELERINARRRELAANRADDDDPIDWGWEELTPYEMAMRDPQTIVSNGRAYNDRYAMQFSRNVDGTLGGTLDGCLCESCEDRRDDYAERNGEPRVYFMSQRVQ